MRRSLKTLGGLAALALTSPAFAQELPSKLLDNDAKFTYQAPKAEETSTINVFAKTTFATKYRTTGGFTMGEGPVNQSLFSLSKSNVLTEGDTAEVYLWSNYDFDTKSFSEVDVGVDYTFPIAKDFLGGKLDGYLEAAHWEYPDGALGDNDKGLIGKLKYEGPISVTLKGTQMLTSGHGREFDLTIGKSLNLGKTEDGTEFTLTPSISTAYLDNFFGFNGITNMQYGAELSIKSGNAALELFLRQQEGFQDGFEDSLVGGIGFSFSF